ncbi:MAG: pyocin activator PrtN family protein [Halorhodospira sp.]
MSTRSPTLLLLMAEHEYRTTLTVEEAGERYWRYTPAHSRRLANEGNFPVPAFRAAESRKAPWLVLLSDLAMHLDACRQQAVKEREALRRASV